MQPDMHHRCDACDKRLKSAAGLRQHIRLAHPPQVGGEVVQATTRAVQAASHIRSEDEGTVAVLMRLASLVDGLPLRDPGAPFDNVTIPTYLKYAAALGLTPESRAKLGLTGPAGSGSLAQLRAVAGGRKG